MLSFNVIIFNLKLKFQTSPLNASDEGELILSNKALSYRGCPVNARETLQGFFVGLSSISLPF